MDRNEYVKRCQTATVAIENRTTKEELTDDILVRYGDIKYIPSEYILTFDGKGNPKHTAVLKSLYSNSVQLVDLGRVEKC
jgi:hypothetical protein